MGRGNPKNLKVLTPDKAREFGRLGGLRSVEVRREKKTMKEIALAMLNDIGKGEKCSNGAAAVAAMFSQAKAGNVAAFKAIAELIGEYEAPSSPVFVSSPIVLGTIPKAKVEKAKAEHMRRLAES